MSTQWGGVVPVRPLSSVASLSTLFGPAMSGKAEPQCVGSRLVVAPNTQAQLDI